MKRLAAIAFLFLTPVCLFAGSGDIVRVKTPVPGEYIVVLNDEVVDVAALSQALAGKHGAVIDRVYRAALKGFAMAATESVARAISSEPLVKYVQQNGTFKAIGSQSGATWGIDRVDQRDLPLNSTYTWNENGTNVRAYIVDTGIRLTHTDFGIRASSGYDAIDGGSADDCNGHGTHVAGTVGGNTWGVAKNVSLIAVRVLNCEGSGTTAQVVDGVDWVTANHVKPAVANMSLGGGVDQVLDDAVKRSIAAGVSYAIAAGNDGDYWPFGLGNACDYSPARVPEANTVGSSTSTDTKSSFSNFGTCVDLFGPGSGITSAWHTSDTATNTISGTSMASPHVAGVIALYLEKNPAATTTQVTTDLEAAASSGKLTGDLRNSPNLLLYSYVASSSTPPPPVPLDPTALIATTASASQINLSWSDNSTNEDGFKIERCQGSGCANFAQIAQVGANVVSYNNTGLSAGTSYSYRVRAFNAGGNSGYSNTASATTDGPPPPPAAPSGLSATAVSSSQINLSWSDNSSNESGFKIERCPGSGCTNFLQIATTGPNVSTFSNTGLTRNTLYSYRVRANNASGDSGYSNTATARTLKR